MAAQWDQAITKVRRFASENPGLFIGLDPRNVIPHLGSIYPDLYNELATAYSNEIETGGGLFGGGTSSKKFSEWEGLGGVGQDILNSAIAQTQQQGVQQQAEAEKKKQTLISSEDKIRGDVAALREKLGGYRTTAQTKGEEAIRKGFIPIRSRNIEEMAQTGLSTQPVGRKVLGDVDRQEAEAISKFSGDFALSAANQDIAVEEYLQNLLTNKEQFDFAKESDRTRFGESTRQFNEQLRQQLEANQMAMALGVAQAEAQKPSTLDKALMGLSAFGGLLGGAGQLYGASQMGKQNYMPFTFTNPSQNTNIGMSGVPSSPTGNYNFFNSTTGPTWKNTYESLNQPKTIQNSFSSMTPTWQWKPAKTTEKNKKVAWGYGSNGTGFGFNLKF